MIKINIGCGSLKKEGYVNIDIDKKFNPDIVADVKKLPYKTNQVKTIFARDVLEHVSHKDVEQCLRHWYDILKKGGNIIIQVPNLLTICGDIMYTNNPDEINSLIRRIYGGQKYSGDYHYNGFTPSTIKELLLKLKFRQVVIQPIKDLETPGYQYNMVVEAVK